MDNRQRVREWEPGTSSRSICWLCQLVFLACSLIVMPMLGCASPGEPTERRLPTPQSVTDLVVTQSGNAAILTFTLPRETVQGHALTDPLTIEIFRDFSPSYGVDTPGPAISSEPTLLVRIPPAVASNYITQGRVRYTDFLMPETLTLHSNDEVTYLVRTRVSAKRDAANSNSAHLGIHPVPNAIDDLEAKVTHSGIVLSWAAPQETPIGTVPPIVSYHVYRSPDHVAAPKDSVVSPNRSTASTPQPASGEITLPLVKIGESVSTSYSDTELEIGSTYTYSVRSVVQYGGKALESADSNLLAIAALDTFPPSAPQGLVIIDIPARSAVPAHLELSWAISPETDLVGYNVYRSEQAGIVGTRVTIDLLPMPAFHDMNAMLGIRYFYCVTAVDRSGNESPPSPIVSGSVPAERP